MNAPNRRLSTRLAALVVATLTALAGTAFVASPASAAIHTKKIAGVVYIFNDAQLGLGAEVAGYEPQPFQTQATILAEVTIDSVTLPVRKINDDAFLGSDSDLESVIFQGTNLLTIGQSAFRTTNLSAVAIPNSVTFIGSNAFEETDLTHVTIPNGVTHIDHDAFNDGFLESVVIGNQVTYIGNDAFSENEFLKSVRFLGPPPTVTSATGTGTDESFDSSGSLVLHYPEFYKQPENTSNGYTNGTWRGYTTETLDPTIAGIPHEGFTVSANPGSYVAPGTTYTYQWIFAENDAAIPGATGPNLYLTKGFAGRTIKVVMTSHSPGPDTETVTSVPVGIGKTYKSLALSSYTVKKGTPVLVTATGLKPRQKYKIQLNKKTRATGKADAAGTVSRWVKFKANTKAGKRTVKVIAKKSKGKPKYSVSTKVKYYK